MTTDTTPRTAAAEVRRETVRRSAAEVRAVEANRVARFDPEHQCFLVNSSSRLGVTYRVRARGADGLVQFSCTCPAGGADGENPRWGIPGSVRCWHQAKAARRLERERLICWNGKEWGVR